MTHTRNVENTPFFNVLIKFRLAKLRAKFLKCVSLTTSDHSQREGSAVDERVSVEPNGAARNYVHTHTHETLNFCMVAFDS